MNKSELPGEWQGSTYMQEVLPLRMVIWCKSVDVDSPAYQWEVQQHDDTFGWYRLSGCETRRMMTFDRALFEAQEEVKKLGKEFKKG